MSKRHFRRAVDRNRIKRLSREAYRLQKQTLYSLLAELRQQWAVFFVFTGTKIPAFEQVYDKFSVILERLQKEAEDKTEPGAAVS